ncbi:hypothetical protein LEP1GSC060_1946 [Leptospira weilii serovar Ranarum str. ICFT]|uniref:Uncharacterized protein n=1 Tax=Leptospira weilii serovar Ranarum str. ICFT TaxID=1218598 RepID=N1WHB0_9LEPT|nr:hypothetical protein LEP1GSC060_1946 [Leptospira weilii serovar Ranarum str. ICFT]
MKYFLTTFNVSSMSHFVSNRIQVLYLDPLLKLWYHFF